MNRDRMRRGVLAPLLTTLILLVAATAAQAATINVNTTSDAAASADECSGASGDCSLRQAVDKANTGDTIQLGSGTYSLTLGSQIQITKTLLLEGDGVANTSIDGLQNASHRIFRVDGAMVTIDGLTLKGGDDGDDEAFQGGCGGPCSTLNANGGGAVFDNGSLILDNVAFENDSAPVGGAVSTSANSGTLTMTDVSFTNGGGSIGGALFTHGGTVNGTGVTFEDNGNGAFDGGAAYLASGTVTLTNSTIVGNGWASSFGGGIDNAGASLTLSNDTFSGNVRGAIETDNGTTSVGNTIIGAGFSDGSDFACVAAGKGNDAGSTTSTAITHDLGNNIDQDGHCNLTGSSDQSNVDPGLVPIADNTGPTRTQALLAGSPALADPATTNCPGTDQRGVSRPSGKCDIGAFEAVINGAPSTPTTDAAQNVTDTSADLAGTINLSGEAGGFHFVYGTTRGDWSSQTDEVGAGVVSSDTPETETLFGLTPDTTYYYAIVADNASDSIGSENVQSFTTQPGPPVISNVSVDSITDTAATVHFTINPQGADTTYFVEYGPNTNYGQKTQTFDAGSAPGDVEKSVSLTGLDPGSEVHFDIVASNDVQQNVDNGDQSFNTLQGVTGIAGQSVTIGDSGDTYTCPSAADTTVDWGDGTSDTGAHIQCSDDGEDGKIFQLTDSHVYATAGDYQITISYSDLDGETDEFAHISANNGPTNTDPPTISGAAQQGQTLITTDGSWDGDPTHFDYQWQDCDANGQHCTNTGTDTNKYMLTSSDVGRTVQVVVTATSAGGFTAKTSNRTAVVTATGGSPAPNGHSAPTVGAATTRTVKVTSAGFEGAVTPNGLPTQAYFQYGLDAKYKGGGPIVYDHSTPAQSVGADFSSHVFGPVAISGLLPNALYHVRLVATNADGTTFGPDVAFTTAAAPPPGAPTLGRTFDVTPVSGFVLIKINGKFVPLTGADQIPSGSVIDARHGSLELITSTGQKGKTQHGVFGGAIFKLIQERSGAEKGLVTLTLVEGAFKGAPSYALCKAHAAADPAATIASSKTLQLLKASAHGKFRTKGRYSAATVRGTIWTIADRCDGTLTHVITDSVAVTDFVRHKTIILRASQSYLAKAHKHK